MIEGRLAGIARRDRPRGAVEVLEAVEVTRERGLAGDWRGSLKPGRNLRQVSIIEAASWEAAMDELGAAEPWWRRRANLLVENLRLPREPGHRIRLGADCIVEVTMECDPCSRMEDVLPGLYDALRPDWRGGALAFVVEPGIVRVGDKLRIET